MPPKTRYCYAFGKSVGILVFVFVRLDIVEALYARFSWSCGSHTLLLLDRVYRWGSDGKDIVYSLKNMSYFAYTDVNVYEKYGNSRTGQAGKLCLTTCACPWSGMLILAVEHATHSINTTNLQTSLLKLMVATAGMQRHYGPKSERVFPPAFGCGAVTVNDLRMHQADP